MSYKDDPASLALRSVPFFSSLDPLDAYSISQHLIPRRFANGQTIFHYGDPGGLLYIINEGKVKITYSTPEGQEARDSMESRLRSAEANRDEIIRDIVRADLAAGKYPAPHTRFPPEPNG